jgi:protein-L-isoaspartate O-methyltransferase
MTSVEQLQQGLADVVREHGPWIAYDIDLGQGVQTIGRTGTAEQRVARVTQLVADLAGPLDGLRVLDLGAHEGGFAIDLARRGATVTAIEGREAHVAKARFVKDTLGLERLTVRCADVRAVELDTYDVVLCVGLLYHLPATDAVALVRRIAAATRLAIIETQVSLSRRDTVSTGGLSLVGRTYGENTAHPGASLDNPASFWPTRPSLLNLLADAGFTSIAEVLVPRVPLVSDYVDRPVMVCARGEAIASPVRVPERTQRMAHASQGLRWRIADRVGRLRGHGAAGVWRKR